MNELMNRHDIVGMDLNSDQMSHLSETDKMKVLL